MKAAHAPRAASSGSPSPQARSVAERIRRSAHVHGFTLVELMVVILIISFLATIGITTYASRMKKARREIAKANMKDIENAINMFYTDQGKLPQALEDLVSRPGWVKEWPDEGYVTRVPNDPWGNKYEYRRPGANNRKFDLVCWGADGAQGGASDDADISLYDDPTQQ